MKKLMLSLMLLMNLLMLNAQHRLESSSQSSVWSSVLPLQDRQWFAGFRFLPGMRYAGHRGALQLQGEASLHLHAFESLIPLDDAPVAGLEPYRLWIRLADSTRSLRIGLQQINFGSATLLRPLMWFDRVNPIDPLGLTEGVWSVLGQAYFGQKASLWLWINLTEKKKRVWDILPSNTRSPELGGRLQWTVPKGEMGLAANLRPSKPVIVLNDQPPGELCFLNYRIGLDGKWDLGPGMWYELSMSGTTNYHGAMSHLALLTLGADYTFGWGNGLNVMVEHMLIAAGSRLRSLPDKAALTAISTSYATDFFNQFRIIGYFVWKNEQPYTFLQYECALSKGKLQLMVWANPENPVLPGREDLKLFGGKGAQILYLVHF